MASVVFQPRWYSSRSTPLSLSTNVRVPTIAALSAHLRRRPLRDSGGPSGLHRQWPCSRRRDTIRKQPCTVRLSDVLVFTWLTGSRWCCCPGPRGCCCTRSSHTHLTSYWTLHDRLASCAVFGVWIKLEDIAQIYLDVSPVQFRLLVYSSHSHI